MAMIKLDQVSKYYRSEETVSVGMKNISLEFELGEFVAVTGESGSGKSTLLNVISGLDGYEDGELFLFNEETSHYTIADWERYRGTYIGFVFQNYNIIDSYTVYQNVVLALEIQGYNKHERKQRALELIDKVGLTSHKNHKASKLSGGQKQRAVIARALAKDCPIIVADEPTGNLDSESAEQVMKLLHDIAKDKLIVVVTHDYDQVKEYATRKIKMHDGEVVEDKQIKKAEIKQLEQLAKPKSMTFFGLLRFALVNLFSTPKKLIFLMIMQILVISVFTIVYTNQVSEIREVGLEQSYIFPSVPETRVLIEKRDGTDFNQSEIDAFEELSYVNVVHPNAMNFYNETRLYIVKGQTDDYYNRGIITATDSVEALNQRDIEGSLPVAINEVVVSAYENFNIGDQIKLNPGNPWEYFGYEQDISIGTFIVTGIDKLDRDIIYFSEAFLAQETSNEAIIDYQVLSQIESSIQYESRINYNNQKNFLYSDPFLNLQSDIEVDGTGERTILTNQSIEFTTYDRYYNEVSYTMTGLSISVPEEPMNGIAVDADVFQVFKNAILEMLENQYTIEPKNYISLSVDGFYGGNKIIDSVDADLYKVYYPANISGSWREMQVFFLSFLAVILLTLFGLFLYSIVHAVTKNVMNARKKDFAIFRSIGANKSTLAKLVVLEQVLMSTIGFILTMIILQFISSNFTLLSADLQYMELKDYFILLFAFMFFGAWLGLRFNKKVFNQSVIETISQSRGE